MKDQHIDLAAIDAAMPPDDATSLDESITLRPSSSSTLGANSKVQNWFRF
jgi:hypothetical protein